MLLILVVLLASLTLACQPTLGHLPERSSAAAPDRNDRTPSGEPSDATGYAGSAPCASCHLEIYEAWKTTSHSYTVLSSHEARRAGYELPSSHPQLRSWSDVSYVVGGRERITFAGADGLVHAESYHHRIQGWDLFPSLPMTTCGPCHFTGVGFGESHPDDEAMPGRWVERSIGCEACHGPGGRHVATQEKRDIENPLSSRTCGQCHTTAGSLLPKDQWHETHDFVQAWNRDPHVTGGRFHSQNSFCARCHAPDQAVVLDPVQDAERMVFREDKQNITCVGCHNPHETTSFDYARDRATLTPPVDGNLHAYQGDDDDTTTADYQPYASKDELCIHCHRGADRIELDHANATCTSCHNTFHANRSLESRIDHDANRPQLSCRPCHADAERMMSIVFEDRDFLQPRYVHDLRSLPAEVMEKYDFRYGELAYGSPPLETFVTVTPPPEPSEPLVPHSRATNSNDVDSSTRVVLNLVGLPTVASASTPRKLSLSEEKTAALRVVLEGAPHDDVNVAFHRGLKQLLGRDLGDAVVSFERALELDPSHTGARIALALVHFESNRRLHARKELERVVRDEPDDPVARYYLGQLELEQQEPARAAEAFATAIELDPDFLTARYALGRSLRLSGRHDESILVYREIVREQPQEFEAHVRLANLYKFSSDRYAIELLSAREGRASPGASAKQHRVRLELLAQRSEQYGRLALGELARALELRPKNVELKRQVSEVLRRAGDLEKAEAYFRWLGEHRPEDWLPLYRLGSILIQRGRDQEAIPVLERAIGVAPTEGDGYVALGLALTRAGSSTRAIEVLERGSVYAPFNPALHTNLGVAYAETGQLDQAESAFRRSLELATFPLPRVHITRTNLALLHLRRGEREAALRELRTALHSFPEYRYAREIASELQAGDEASAKPYAFVLNDLLERFGEVTTVAFE